MERQRFRSIYTHAIFHPLSKKIPPSPGASFASSAAVDASIPYWSFVDREACRRRSGNAAGEVGKSTAAEISLHVNIGGMEDETEKGIKERKERSYIRMRAWWRVASKRDINEREKWDPLDQYALAVGRCPYGLFCFVSTYFMGLT